MQIQAEVNTATAKATDEAADLLTKRINEMTDKAIGKIDEEAEKIAKSLKAVCNGVSGAKNEINYERGFRKFMFWVTPVLLLIQSIFTMITILK